MPRKNKEKTRVIDIADFTKDFTLKKKRSFAWRHWFFFQRYRTTPPPSTKNAPLIRENLIMGGVLKGPLILMCDVNLGYLQIQLHFFYQSGSRLEIFVRNKKQDIDLCKNVWKIHFWGRFLLLSTPDSRDPVWNMMDMSKNSTFSVQRGTTISVFCFISRLAAQLASRWSTLAVPPRPELVL